MPKLIKGLRIFSVDSVNRGAGIGTEVKIIKHERGNEMTMTFSDISKAVRDEKIPFSDFIDAVDNEVVKSGLSLNQITAKRDHPLNPYINERIYLERNGFAKAGIDVQGAGGLPPGAKADDDEDEDEDHAGALEALVTAHMSKNPGTTKSKAYHAVMRTPKGAAVATRAILGSGQTSYRHPQQGNSGRGVTSDLRPDMSRATR